MPAPLMMIRMHALRAELRLDGQRAGETASAAQGACQAAIFRHSSAQRRQASAHRLQCSA